MRTWEALGTWKSLCWANTIEIFSFRMPLMRLLQSIEHSPLAA